MLAAGTGAEVKLLHKHSAPWVQFCMVNVAHPAGCDHAAPSLHIPVQTESSFIYNLP